MLFYISYIGLHILIFFKLNVVLNFETIETVINIGSIGKRLVLVYKTY